VITTGNPLTDFFGNALFGGIGAGPPRKSEYEVITGPKFTPGGDAIPYAYQERTSVTYGSRAGGNQFTTGATRITPSPYYKTQSIEDAARTYYQDEPGEQVTSYAPGARQIWQDLSAGYLPDIGRASNGGGTMAPGLPQWLPIAGIVVLAAVLLARKRR